jgi:hypothetical protein
VFSTTGRIAVSGFTKAKAALDRITGVADWCLHNTRRTGVSALARMGIDSLVADKLARRSSNARRNTPEVATVSARALIGRRACTGSLVRYGSRLHRNKSRCRSRAPGADNTRRLFCGRPDSS